MLDAPMILVIQRPRGYLTVAGRQPACRIFLDLIDDGLRRSLEPEAMKQMVMTSCPETR